MEIRECDHLCEPFQNDMTLDDLSNQFSSNISKDRLMSLITIKISKNGLDAIELITNIQQCTDFSKTIYITLIKGNVRYLLTWHGHDKEFNEEIGFFYLMVNSFEFV